MQTDHTRRSYLTLGTSADAAVMHDTEKTIQWPFENSNY